MRLRVLLFLLLLFLMPPFSLRAAPINETLEISGWIPYWRAERGVLEVLPNLHLLTTVHPFAYVVGEDGTLKDKMGMDEGPMLALREAARVEGVRFIPTVMWHDGPAIHAILSNGEERRALEDKIANLAKEKDFDGIDIDFEAKFAETNPYFSLFLKGLYMRMGSRWVYCTIEPRTPLSSRYDKEPAPGAGLYANNYVEINKYCDRVQIMAYDQGSVDVKLNKKYEGPYAPVSDIMWVKKVAELAAETISKRKIVLGVPTYGYEYAVTPLSVEGYHYSLQWAFNPSYAYELAEAWGITPQRSRGGELFFTYVPTTTPKVLDSNVPTASQAVGPVAASTQPFNILWWGDNVSIAQKAALAKDLGFRGIAIFKFDGGADKGMWGTLAGR